MNNMSASQTTTTKPLRVEDHLDLVWKVARQVARRLPTGVRVEELVGAGTLGLMDAVARYREERCDRFIPYAEIRIRGAILDQLRAMDTAPRSVRRAARQLANVESGLRHRLRRAPETTEVAAVFGVDAGAIEKMRRAVVSVEFARDVDVEDAVAATARADDVCIDKEQLARLSAGIAQLPERLQQVLSLHYVDGLKLKEIGDLLDVTESRVCQIVKEAAKRLRAVINDD